MVSNTKKTSKRSMSFDLNLVPFIDVLSTCICFLLVTAVFMQLGTLNVKQALGDSDSGQKADQPALWMQMNEDGSIVASVKNVPKSKVSEMSISTINGRPHWGQVTQSLTLIKQNYPQVTVALILPKAQSRYEDLIQLMGLMKKGSYQVGIAPL